MESFGLWQYNEFSKYILFYAKCIIIVVQAIHTNTNALIQRRKNVVAWLLVSFSNIMARIHNYWENLGTNFLWLEKVSNDKPGPP